MLRLSNLINRQHPLNAGRVAWYLTVPGLDGGPRWYDLYGLNHGVFGGTNNANSGFRPTTRPGGWGHVAFDGTGSYADLGSSAVLGSASLTLAAWVNVSNFAVDARYILADFNGAGSLSNGSLHYRTSGGGGVFRIFQTFTSGANGNLSTLTVRSNNTWYRVVFVRNDVTKTYQLYVNGVQDSANGTYPGLTPTSLQGNKYIGRSSATFGDYFPGRLDDVCLWNRALSAAEVRQDYDQSVRGYPNALNYGVLSNGPSRSRWWFLSLKDLNASSRGQAAPIATLAALQAMAASISGQAATLATLSRLTPLAGAATGQASCTSVLHLYRLMSATAIASATATAMLLIKLRAGGVLTVGDEVESSLTVGDSLNE